jgi:hypothetical protein
MMLPKNGPINGLVARRFVGNGQDLLRAGGGNEGIMILPEKDPMKRFIAQRPVQSESIDQYICHDGVFGSKTLCAKIDETLMPMYHTHAAAQCTIVLLDFAVLAKRFVGAVLVARVKRAARQMMMPISWCTMRSGLRSVVMSSPLQESPR